MTEIADILIQNSLFLATASDEELDPDVAVEQLESMAFAARHLPEDQKESLRKSIKSRLEKASGEERAVLEELEDNFGL
jgi:hypothetical protein